MKKILYIMMAAVMFAACGNGNIDPDVPPTPTPPEEKPEEKPVEKLADRIVAEWHSTSIAVNGDIYLSFSNDGKFELYQKIGDGAYRLYRGTWSINESTAVLSGKYNDSEAWASSYKVEFSGSNMTMTSTDASAEKSTYAKAAIPAEVKENCVVEVKGEADCIL